MGLSVSVPTLIKKTNQPFLTQVKTIFEKNRELILVSSLIVSITIYLALKISPSIEPIFSNLTGLQITPTNLNSPTQLTDSTINFSSIRPRLDNVTNVNELPTQLKNLIRLMNR